MIKVASKWIIKLSMKFKGTLTIELTDKTYNTNKTDIKTQSVAFRSIARQVFFLIFYWFSTIFNGFQEGGLKTIRGSELGGPKTLRASEVMRIYV